MHHLQTSRIPQYTTLEWPGDHCTAIPKPLMGIFRESHRRKEAVDVRLSRRAAMRSGGLDPHRLDVQVFVELL
jgi:hypothetical protein